MNENETKTVNMIIAHSCSLPGRDGRCDQELLGQCGINKYGKVCAHAAETLVYEARYILSKTRNLGQISIAAIDSNTAIATASNFAPFIASVNAGVAWAAKPELIKIR